MKIQVQAEQTGAEILESFVRSLKENNLTVATDQVKIVVISKDGKEVQVTPDRLKIVYNS